MNTERKDLSWKPVTFDRWTDFESLFGEKGACGGCWCMMPRWPKKLFETNKGKGTKAGMKRLIKAGTIPGILVYDHGRAVAWCAVGPRDDYDFLSRSRTLQPVDDRPVWSIVCLFLDKSIRKQGLSRYVIEAAAEFAKQSGATIIEAYPFRPPKGKLPDPFVWTGLTTTYEAIGFTEAASHSKNRPIMRLTLS